MSLNSAFSLELGECIPALKAHELSLQGLLINQKAFECLCMDDPKKATCVNMGKPSLNMVVPVHFRTYPKCESCGSEEQAGQGESKTNPHDINNMRTDVFAPYDVPLGYFQGGQKLSKEDVKLRKQAYGMRNNTHEDGYYTITPFVLNYIQLLIHNRVEDDFKIKIRGKSGKEAQVYYRDMFQNIRDTDFNPKLPPRIYTDSAKIKEMQNGSALIQFGGRFKGLETHRVSLFVKPDEVVGFIRQKIGEALNSGKQCRVFTFGVPVEQKKPFINIDLKAHPQSSLYISD